MKAINRGRMRGVYVVEFAIIGLLLFTLLFGVLEMGRLYFTVGTLNEVVRRGARLAAVCQISDPVVLRRAIFNDEGNVGPSSLIGNLDTLDLTLVYLGEDGTEAADPGDIRYVQLSIVNFPFRLLIPAPLGGDISLPTFRATLPSESLGSDGETEVPTSC